MPAASVEMQGLPLTLLVLVGIAELLAGVGAVVASEPHPLGGMEFQGGL